MPVYEQQQKKGWGWPAYLAIGCGGCAVLLILVPFVMGLMGTLFVGRQINQMMNPAPIKRTHPYHWGYWSEASSVVIPLPAGNGQLRYAQCLLSYRVSPGYDQRVVKLVCNGRVQEWPLDFTSGVPAKVAVYWHPAISGQKPVIRFLDDSGERALDLQSRDVGDIDRSGGRAYLAFHSYDDTTFSSSSGESTTTVNGKTTTKYTSADGTPAHDVTAVLSSAKCVYLGSIIRKGKKLIFVPASKRP